MADETAEGGDMSKEVTESGLDPDVVRASKGYTREDVESKTANMNVVAPENIQGDIPEALLKLAHSTDQTAEEAKSIEQQLLKDTSNSQQITSVEQPKEAVRSIGEIPPKFVAEFEAALLSKRYLVFNVLGEVQANGYRAMEVQLPSGSKHIFALKPEGIFGIDPDEIPASENTPILSEEDFNNAVKTKELNGHRVLEEIDWGGRRAIEVEYPEGKVVIALGIKRPEASGSVKDPIEADLVDEATFTKWVEDKIRYEESKDHEVEPRTMEDLKNTVLAVDELGPVSGLKTRIDPEVKNRLANRVLARLRYHTAYYNARFGLANLSGDYYNMSDGPNTFHKEILFETKGVKEVIKELSRTKGAYFRMNNDEPEKARSKEERRIRNMLRAAGVGDRANMALAPDDEFKADDAAKLAFELAIKAMSIFGEAGYYDGIKVTPGTVYHDKGGSAVAVEPDGWISAEVLEQMYPDIPNGEFALERRYARFFKEHWEDIAFYRYIDGAGAIQYANTREQAEKAGGKDIAFNAIAGNGALQERATYYYPAALENPQTPEQGRAVSLRKYMYTWINSGVRFMRDPNDDTVRKDLGEFLDHFNDDNGKYFIWVDRVSRAMKARGQLNEKKLDSIMNMPLINPNALLFKDDEGTISSVMGNFRKAADAYEHLPDDQRQIATAELLGGLLRYASWKNVHIANMELKTHWAGLSNKNMEDAIWWAVSEGLISEDQVAGIYKEATVSGMGAFLEDATFSLAGGFWGSVKAAFGVITK